MATLRINRFWSVVATFLIVYAALVNGGSRRPRARSPPCPSRCRCRAPLMFIYMTLTVVALFLFVTFSDDLSGRFSAPGPEVPERRLRQDPAHRWTLIVLPYPGRPGRSTPSPCRRSSCRYRCASSTPRRTFPKSFEALQRIRSPIPAMPTSRLSSRRSKANEVMLIPSGPCPTSRPGWRRSDPEHMLAFIPTEPGRSFSPRSRPARWSMETARAALAGEEPLRGPRALRDELPGLSRRQRRR